MSVFRFTFSDAVSSFEQENNFVAIRFRTRKLAAEAISNKIIELATVNLSIWVFYSM